MLDSIQGISTEFVRFSLKFATESFIFIDLVFLNTNQGSIVGSGNIRSLLWDHIRMVFLTSVWVYAPEHIHFTQPSLCEYCVLCFFLLCLPLMPLCPCNPSKPWILMHRLPYFSKEMTVACRENCMQCVCVLALVPFLEASLCSLCTNAQATEASWVHFFCGWTTYPRILLYLEVCVFFSSHRKEDKLLYCLPVLY